MKIFLIHFVVYYLRKINELKVNMNFDHFNSTLLGPINLRIEKERNHKMLKREILCKISKIDKDVLIQVTYGQ